MNAIKVVACILLATGAITTSAAPTERVKYSARGASCEPMEFAEINSLRKRELESMICSAALSWENGKGDFDDLGTKQYSPEVRNRLQGVVLEKMEQCSSFKGKLSDVYERKFKGVADCSTLHNLKRNIEATAKPTP